MLYCAPTQPADVYQILPLVGKAASESSVPKQATSWFLQNDEDILAALLRPVSTSQLASSACRYPKIPLQGGK